MKKRILSFMIITILVLSTVLAGCSTGNTPAQTTTAAPKAEVIKLGVIGPLTGDYSQYGVAVEEGAKLAAEEINAAGGINGAMIEIKAYDSKGDKTEGVNAYNRLRDQDGIVGLIGGTFSGETLAIKEIAVEDGMPILTPTATNLEVTLNAPNVFRACYTDPQQGSTAAIFSKEELGATKAAVLFNIEDPYSEGLAVAFKEEFEKTGTVTSYEGYTKNDADFKSVLTKIQAQNPEVIFLPDYIAKVGVILAQIQEMGLDVVCIGGDGWDGIEIDYADVAEGHYFVNHYSKTDPADIVQNFITAYEAKWNKTPNALAALGYDATKIMAEAIKNAGSTDAAAIVEKLAATDMDGVAGHVTFNEDGDPNKSISIIQVISGEHVLAGKVEAK
jgi:branched-chain amino acid transport system substrate-binding protein